MSDWTKTRWVVLLSVATAGCAASVAPHEEQRLAAERAAEPHKLVSAGDGFAALGDFTRAEQYYELALQQGAERRRLVPRLIQVCVRDQRYRDAIQYAEQHLRKFPRDHAVRFLLAGLAMGVGEAHNAKKELERLLAARPAHADAHYALAVVLRDDLGDLGRADQHFRTYLRLAPDGRHAEEARGSLLEELP